MAFSRKYNESNVTDRGPRVLPTGRYRVRVAEVQDKISRTSGKDMIELTLEVADGQYRGSRLWVYIVDDQYADQRIHDIFESCGQKVPEVVTSASFRGLTGEVQTRLREYNGETKAEVNYWVRPRPGAGAAAPQSQGAGSPAAADDIPF